MRESDAIFLDTLRKSVAANVDPGVWETVEKQVAEVGVLGLTGTGRALIEGLVRKHGGKGDHDESDHGNWARGSKGGGGSKKPKGGKKKRTEAQLTNDFLTAIGGAIGSPTSGRARSRPKGGKKTGPNPFADDPEGFMQLFSDMGGKKKKG
jgi:hypothetical protein